MNGNEDGLTRRGKLAQEPDDVVRRLAIETRSGLVEEEQKLGLRRELNSDGDSLACLDVESKAGEADHGVREVLELKQLDDVFDVGVLLFLRNVRRLAEVR